MIDPPDIPEGGKVIGVGIDQIEVSRIRDSLDQHGSSFLDKIFTSAEQAYCSDKANPAPHYAARFAAKEAVAKHSDRTWQGVWLARCGSDQRT